ncbi:hypothetical protein HEK616_34510 [Streptomyces nigrescens]|uniref:Uncharacterized protein n=2 Tax=Streptomyces TaxID=1883 RepID=A0ABM7ZUC0_STRNI|nr:hypothetical protein [Streptomyces nigrescens]MEE4422448.1 hypothetical protein [Streptomyces sp. DSM 41528]BDM69964.1 hypothetical protein HEK616_34510 [Streptomyces nigrescens]
MTPTGIEAALTDLVFNGDLTPQEAADGSRYADRHTARLANLHTAHLAKKDGASVHTEWYVCADLAADGRFSRIGETALMLQGSSSDRNIGSAHQPGVMHRDVGSTTSSTVSCCGKVPSGSGGWTNSSRTYEQAATRR